MLDHEGRFFGGHVLCGDDEVAFVFRAKVEIRTLMRSLRGGRVNQWALALIDLAFLGK